MRVCGLTLVDEWASARKRLQRLVVDGIAVVLLAVVHLAAHEIHIGGYSFTVAPTDDAAGDGLR